MSVIIADASNSNYTTGGLSVANGFYRVEASNIGTQGNSNTSQGVEVDIPVTFANAGNCQGIVLALIVPAGANNQNSTKDATVTLQENVATVWTNRATVTLTAAQIMNMTTRPDFADLPNSVWIVAFSGGTFPYPVDTTAAKWRFAFTSTNTQADGWSLKTSNNTAPFYAAWCDNKVTFSSGNDAIIAKDKIIIDQSATLLPVSGTGDTTDSTAAIACTCLFASTPANVAKIEWQNPPVSSYTLAFKGWIVIGSHGGFRVGTATSRIPVAQQAIITINAATGGQQSFSGFAGPQSFSNKKQNIFFWGEIPAVESAILATDVTAGASAFTTTTATGWAANDVVAIGRQAVVSSTADASAYTISSVSFGTVVNTTAPIATYDRKATGFVIRFNGYGISITWTGTGSLTSTCSYTCCQVSGVGLKANTPVNTPNIDEPASFDYVNPSMFISHVGAYATGVAFNPNNGGPAYLGETVVEYLNLMGGGIIASLTRVLIAGLMPGNRVVKLRNCLELSGQAGFNFNRTNIQILMSNCKIHHAVGYSIYADSTVSNCEFWGSPTALFLNPSVNSRVSACTFDFNGTGVTISNAARGYVENCIFGAAAPNTQCDVSASIADSSQAETSARVAFVSPISGTNSLTIGGGIQRLSVINSNPLPDSYFTITNFNSVANDDRFFGLFGNIQRTGPGLTDTTSRTAGGFAMRLQPVSYTAGPNNSVFEFPVADRQLRMIPTSNAQGKPITVSAWVNIANAAFYAGTHANPTLNLRYDGTNDMTAVAANTPGVWQQVALTVTPATTTPFVEAWMSSYTDATGTNAYYYLDDMAVGYPPGVSVSPGSLDMWGFGMPLWPPVSTFPSSTAIQTLTASIAPLATAETLLYTVPANALSCVISSIMVSNRGVTATTFRVSISPNSAATATKDYLYYDVTLNPNDTFAATLGITPAATSAIRVYAGNGNLSFSIWGSLVS